jgi:hypothetical protein
MRELTRSIFKERQATHCVVFKAHKFGEAVAVGVPVIKVTVQIKVFLSRDSSLLLAVAAAAEEQVLDLVVVGQTRDTKVKVAQVEVTMQVAQVVMATDHRQVAKAGIMAREELQDRAAAPDHPLANNLAVGGKVCGSIKD